jgi:hypothetical protein
MRHVRQTHASYQCAKRKQTFTSVDIAIHGLRVRDCFSHRCHGDQDCFQALYKFDSIVVVPLTRSGVGVLLCWLGSCSPEQVSRKVHDLILAQLNILLPSVDSKVEGF